MAQSARRSISQQAQRGHCPACGKPFARRDERVRIGGVLFHRSCAVFESRSTRHRGAGRARGATGGQGTDV